jgi:hypothetical protein
VLCIAGVFAVALAQAKPAKVARAVPWLLAGKCKFENIWPCPFLAGVYKEEQVGPKEERVGPKGALATQVKSG